VNKFTKVVDLAMPLRDLTLSESYRGQLGRDTENLFGDAVRFSSRGILARKGSVDKKKIYVAVGVSVAARCGAEGARVQRRRFPAQKRLTQALPELES
jgi:hypothetical protein